MSAANPWAPDLPLGWETTNLRWLAARIFAGGTPDKANLDFWTDGTVPWLNSGAVNDWIITEPSTLITEAAFRSSSAQWVPAGSVVIGLAGQGRTKGMSARLRIDSTCNQSMAAIVPGRGLADGYLHYWLVANYQRIRNMAGGDKRDGLNLEHLGSIPIPKPPLEDQHVIAEYLDEQIAKIDRLIAKQHDLIRLLAERRIVVRSVLATRGADYSAEVVEEGPTWAVLRPQHWKTRPLTSVARLESGHTPSRTDLDLWVDCDVPWISLQDLSTMAGDEYISETAVEISHAGIAASSARILPAGTVVVSRDATIGRSAIMAREMATSQHFADWVCGPDLEPRYLWLLFTSAMQIHFDTLTDGSTIKTIGMGDMRSLKIPLPPIAEQRQIVEYAADQTSDIDALIAKTRKHISLANERRSALITAAVTGQFDVRAASSRGVA